MLDSGQLIRILGLSTMKIKLALHRITNESGSLVLHLWPQGKMTELEFRELKRRIFRRFLDKGGSSQNFGKEISLDSTHLVDIDFGEDRAKPKEDYTV